MVYNEGITPQMEPLDPPLIFSKKRQRIFAFIWENPNCTTRELIATFYPRSILAKETITVHLSMIRAGLAEATTYQLVTSKSAKLPRVKEYKIIKRTTANANVNF